MGSAARACLAARSPRLRKRPLGLRGVWAEPERAHAQLAPSALVRVHFGGVAGSQRRVWFCAWIASPAAWKEINRNKTNQPTNLQFRSVRQCVFYCLRLYCLLGLLC